MTIVREQKKRPLRFFAVLQKTILALTKKNFNKIWRYPFWEFKVMEKVTRSTTKKFHFSFFGDRFGILGEFPLRIWFSDPHGTCRF